MKRIVVLCVLWLACSKIALGTDLNDGYWRLPKAISGKVIDETTNLPVIAALTAKVAGFRAVEFSSDSLGRFSVSLPTAAQCTITVRARGFDSKEQTIEVSESTSDYIEILLTPKVKLRLNGTVFGGIPDHENPLTATLTVYLNSDFIKEDSLIIYNGRFDESFTNFGWYIMEFSAPGYAHVIDTMWVVSADRQTIHKDYHLVPLDSNIPVAMSDIQFDFDQSSLPANGITELNYLAQFLKHYPDKRVEIRGYTDNFGPSEYNLNLSRVRADAVFYYLKNNGVGVDQLFVKGLGEEKPVDTNATMAGRAKNRRVELLVLDKSTEELSKSAYLEKISFDLGETQLSRNSYKKLDDLVKTFRNDMTAYFEIAGHTDNTGPEDFNDFLSRERAQAVAKYLETHGISHDRFIVKGYGSTKPIDTNTTNEGRANNRRVDIIALPAYRTINLLTKNQSLCVL